MKITIPTTIEVEVAFIKLRLPVRHDDEDIPYDFPLRDGDTWSAVVEIDSGKIVGWPIGQSGDLYLKVCDEGRYALTTPDLIEVASLDDGYVPHDIVPGEFGDYVDLKIDENGVIRNWPKQPSFSAFFKRDDD